MSNGKQQQLSNCSDPALGIHRQPCGTGSVCGYVTVNMQKSSSYRTTQDPNHQRLTILHLNEYSMFGAKLNTPKRSVQKMNVGTRLMKPHIHVVDPLFSTDEAM